MKPKLVVGVSCKQRVTERIKHGRPAGVHRQLQVINDSAHPPAFRSVGKPEFVELPTIFVIFQPQKQLVDHVVQVHLLGSQTRVVTRTLSAGTRGDSSIVTPQAYVVGCR